MISNNASANCVDPQDCDNDGTPNDKDACPGLAGDHTADLVYHKGFQPLTCFEELIKTPVAAGGGNLLFDPNCLPVAARQIEDTIPTDSLHLSKGSRMVRGIVYVGIATLPNAIAALSPATAEQVKAGFASGVLPNDTLFGCMGSITFNDQHEVDSPVSVYGYKASASYVRAVFFSSDATGYRPDGFGLFRKVRHGLTGWKPGFAGTNGTVWDDSEWDTTSDILSSSDYPSAISSYVDGACYDALVNPVKNYPLYVRTQSTIETISASKDKDLKPWSILPDPGPDDIFSWTSDFKTQQEFEVSDSGQVAAARTSVFGMRPLMSDFEAFQIPLNKSLKIPGTKLPGAPPPYVPPKPKPHKYGDGQFDEPGSIDSVDWGSITSAEICVKDPKDYPQQCCTSDTDALVFDQLKDNPVMSSGPVFGTTYGDFFGAYSSLAQSRAIDDWAETVGGDVPVYDAIKKTNTPGFAPNWPMIHPLSAVALKVGSGPTCKQLDVPTLQGGVWVRSSDGTGIAENLSDWTFLRGTAYSAISPLGLGSIERGIARIWDTPLGNGFHAVSAQVADTSCFEVWSPGPVAGQGKWLKPAPVTIPDNIDYVELDVPDSVWSTTEKLDFANPQRTDLIASRHRGFSTWHPGADLWETNYPSQPVNDAMRVPPPAIGVGVGASIIQANPANQVATTLLQNVPDNNSYLSKVVHDYSARVDVCQQGNYAPYDADAHWVPFDSPAPDKRVVLTGLYGQQQADPDSPPPSANFPSGDLVKRGVDIVGKDRLHEGLDVNWTFLRKYIEPSDQNGNFWNLVESMGGSDAYCHAQLIATDSYDVAIPCSDPAIAYCGDAALVDNSNNGCNPFQKIAGEILDLCDPESCIESCSSGCQGHWYDLFCEAGCGVVCIGGWEFSCGYALLHSEVGLGLDYSKIALLCPLITGGDCTLNTDMYLFKQFRADDDKKIDIEVEHRLLYGKIDGEEVCEPHSQCTFEDYPRLNEMDFGNNGQCQVDDHMKPTGQINKGINFPNDQTYPFTFAPGLAYPRNNIDSRILQSGMPNLGITEKNCPCAEL